MDKEKFENVSRRMSRLMHDDDFKQRVSYADYELLRDIYKDLNNALMEDEDEDAG